MNVTPTREGPRINEEINVVRVRLVDEAGGRGGVGGRNEAPAMAADAGLDLVEIAPGADPPVCKILDFGKFKYEEQKKKNEARNKQKIIEVKEIKLRPSSDGHDYAVKMRSMNKFIEEGDKVKVTMRFRGRELAHQELGMNVLMRVKEDLDEIARVEQCPRRGGRCGWRRPATPTHPNWRGVRVCRWIARFTPMGVGHPPLYSQAVKVSGAQ